MSMNPRLALIAVLAALTGCAAKDYVYKLYPGAVRPTSELVVIELSTINCTAVINDISVDCRDYGQVHLLPGQHQILTGWYRKPLTEAAERTRYSLYLPAGSRYQVRATAHQHHDGYRYWSRDWLVDMASGEELITEVHYERYD